MGHGVAKRRERFAAPAEGLNSAVEAFAAAFVAVEGEEQVGFTYSGGVAGGPDGGGFAAED